MGLRFRRRIKILPGLYANVSKSGLSFSAGVRGASVTFGGKGGTYLNAGIPGSGIYTRQKINDGFSSQGEETEEIEIDLETIKSDLNDEELEIFNNTFRKRKKSVFLGVLLTLFPCGFGFHKFYLGVIPLYFYFHIIYSNQMITHLNSNHNFLNSKILF